MKHARLWFDYLYRLTYTGLTQMDRTAAFVWHDFWCQVGITALYATDATGREGGDGG
jgi:hypothetical protein